MIAFYLDVLTPHVTVTIHGDLNDGVEKFLKAEFDNITVSRSDERWWLVEFLDYPTNDDPYNDTDIQELWERLCYEFEWREASEEEMMKLVKGA